MRAPITDKHLFEMMWERFPQIMKRGIEQPAQQEPVLQDIEQYRLQMAGISTAAIGYWKESDGIHPDYDTIALRDVAKLYAKYDELYRAQRTWVGLEKSDMPDGADPLFDDPKFIAGMVYAANKLMEKNT